MHSQRHILAWIVDCIYIASNSATVSGWLSFSPWPPWDWHCRALFAIVCRCSPAFHDIVARLFCMEVDPNWGTVELSVGVEQRTVTET